MKPIGIENKKRASRYNIEALARGLDILELFSPENPSLSLTEAVSLLNLSKSTVFRLLSTLETMGYLERDPATRRYHPSIKILHLGFTVINGLEVRQVARPHLERLAREVEETVSLCVLDGTDVTYVDRVRNKSIVGVILKIGSRIPAHCTTMGKVLLADLPPVELDLFLSGAELAPCTPRTISEQEPLRSELSEVRKNGYAICDGELAVGLRAAGAPIYNYQQKAVAAINVSGSSATISINRLKKIIVPAVVKTAAQISFALGYAPAEIREGWNTILK
ncbi:MAG: IclR family transcriptional regulator [Pseudomonadota bacterium]